jgi:predicted nucleic acid-binding Zn ribbon protein
MAQSLGSIIKEWLRANNLDVPMKEHSVPGYWPEVVGATLARHATVERLDRGALFVHCESAAWRTEVMLRREEIRARINERLGAEIVREIIVR